MTHPCRQAKALLLLALLCLGLFAIASASHATMPAILQAKQEQVDAKTIRDLIKQLGDDAFDKREEAGKRLAAIGQAAFELLKQASMDNPDAEIRQRARELLQAIGNKDFFVVKTFDPIVKNGLGVTRVVLTPDGKQVIGAGGGPPTVWDMTTAKQEAPLPPRPGAPCYALAISPDGSRVIIGCDGKNGHVYNLKTGKKIRELSGHTAQIRGAALPDNKTAVTGGYDQTIRVWAVDSGTETRRFEGVTDMISCLTVSPDGKFVAAGHFAKTDGPGTIRLWDFETGVEIRSLAGHSLEVTNVAFAPDGKSLLSCSFDKTVRLWDVETGKELKRLGGQTGRVENAAFTPDGKRIVSCGDERDSCLRLWDIQTGQQLLQSGEVAGAITGLAILADGRHCVSSGTDGAIRLWEWKK